MIIIGAEKMKCPECLKEGKRSRVYVGESSTTAMRTFSYYDEDGEFHHDDPNITTTSYSCSEGHNWYARTRSNGRGLSLD